MYEPFTDEDCRPFLPPPSLLPPGLAEMEPGPGLGKLLSELESLPLSGYERALLVAAHQKMVSYHQAESYRLISLLYQDYLELSGGQPEEATWATTTELSALLHLSNRGAELELGRALSLLRLPPVHTALRRGVLDLYRAETIVNSHRPSESRRRPLGIRAGALRGPGSHRLPDPGPDPKALLSGRSRGFPAPLRGGGQEPLCLGGGKRVRDRLPPGP